MKKSHKFDVLSDKQCVESKCRKLIKQRLVETKEPHKILRCYQHGMVIKRQKQNERTER